MRDCVVQRCLLDLCRDAAAAPHTRVNGSGGRRGRRAGGGLRGGAHRVSGLKFGTLVDEVVEAVEVGVVSRLHEGRFAFLRRHGAPHAVGGRSAAAARAGQQGRRAARAEGEGGG